jgi:DNA-binding PadR family transcriptional regulator
MAPKHPSNPLALAVLALVFERPMHPYEMASVMKQRHKHDSIKLRYGSLYTVIDLLVQRGLIEAKETKREGARPERTVYRITPPGRAELMAWMRDLVGEPVKEYPQFEAGLCLLPVLPPDEALALLHGRVEKIDANIKALSGHLRGIGPDFPALFLVETDYRLAMLTAERRFVAELIGKIAKGWGPLKLWRGIHIDRKATMEKLYREFGGGPES